jgi:predicted metal-dependent HD superfamily phosphohydrolase
MNLRSRWNALAKSPAHADWTWGVLYACYANTGRNYHNLEHIEACLTMLDQLVVPLLDKRIAELALWWHDAVYVPGDKTNEALSAALLTGVVGALGVDERERSFACRCILATQHADAWKFTGNPTVDAVLDIDLSVLGAPPTDYAAYVSAVRREFGHVDDAAWRVGRSKFIREMLGREYIFRTEAMHDWFEAAARTNLAGELAHLTES